MQITRRDTLALTGATMAVTLLPLAASATPEEAMARIAEFTGGAEAGEGAITLTAPEIAENGATVPIEVSAPGAKRISIIADNNPSPETADVVFGELAAAELSTRIRLAGTQNVVAVAEMADGSFVKTASAVKVTIGGCGG